MLPASDLAAYSALVFAWGAFLLKVDRWRHSPAALKKEIDAINRRLDVGNARYSTGMGKVNSKVEEVDNHLEAVDKRVVRLEAFEEERANTPRPRNR